MSDREGNRGKSYVEFALLSMVGTQFVVSIFIGFGIGYWLDSRWGTKPLFMLVFIVFGVAAAFLNLYRTLKSRNRALDNEEGNGSGLGE